MNLNPSLESMPSSQLTFFNICGPFLDTIFTNPFQLWFRVQIILIRVQNTERSLKISCSISRSSMKFPLWQFYFASLERRIVSRSCNHDDLSPTRQYDRWPGCCICFVAHRYMIRMKRLLRRIIFFCSGRYNGILSRCQKFPAMYRVSRGFDTRSEFYWRF